MIKIMMIQPPCISDLFSIFPDNVNNQFDKKKLHDFPNWERPGTNVPKSAVTLTYDNYLPPGYWWRSAVVLREVTYYAVMKYDNTVLR